MPKLTLELEPELYRLLHQAAQGNRLSLEEECLRRLAGEARRSHYAPVALYDGAAGGSACR